MIKKKYDNELKPQILNNGRGVQIAFEEKKIHLWDRSIVIYETSNYFSDLAEYSKKRATYDFIQLIKGLERKLGASFTIKRRYVFKICKEHYSFFKDYIEDQINSSGQKLSVYNEYGQWLSVDQSLGFVETEIQKNKDPDYDKTIRNHNGLQNYLNSHERTGFEITPEFILQTMNGIQQNQLVFSENMASHVEAIKSIGAGIKANNEIMQDQKIVLCEMREFMTEIRNYFRSLQSKPS